MEPTTEIMDHGQQTQIYTHFYDLAQVNLHSDGKSVIVLSEPSDPDEWYREKPGWATDKLRIAYEHLKGDEHPRIVRYDRTLEDGSIVLEKLWPGPLGEFYMPKNKDGIMISLYYRWALQSLSALSFLHAHDVYVESFDNELVWLRPDLSLAITGFISNTIIGVEEEDWGENGGSRAYGYPECFPEYDEHARTRRGGVRIGPIYQDLHNWARWLYCLITTEAEQERPYDRGEMVNHKTLEATIATDLTNEERRAKRKWVEEELERSFKQEYERHGSFLFGALGEDRMESVFTKIWHCEYHSAEEVVKDIRECAARIGIKVVDGDEVDIGCPWIDAFKVEADQYFYWDQRLGSKKQDHYWPKSRLVPREWPTADELAALVNTRKPEKDTTA